MLIKKQFAESARLRGYVGSVAAVFALAGLLGSAMAQGGMEHGEGEPT